MVFLTVRRNRLLYPLCLRLLKSVCVAVLKSCEVDEILWNRMICDLIMP